MSRRIPCLVAEAVVLLGLACLAPSAAQAALVITAKPVAWWEGDLNALDVLQTSSGALIGSVGFAPGLIGSSFDFSGSGFVQVPSNPVLEPATITVTAYVKASGSP